MHEKKYAQTSMATIFLFLGLRISWVEKRVGRSEKKKKIQNNYIGPKNIASVQQGCNCIFQNCSGEAKEDFNLLLCPN